MPEKLSGKFNLHKVLATIGIVLMVTIIAVIIVWLYIKKTAPEIGTANNIRVSTSSATTAVSSVPVDEKESWNILTNNTAGYMIKYPTTWFLNGTANKPDCDDESVFLAPQEDLLGQCASGYAGLVYIARTTEGDTLDLQVGFYKEEDYDNFKKENITVGGKITVKISGVSKVSNQVIDKIGNKEIHYLIDLGNRALIVSYNQPRGTQDYSETFEKIVSTLEFI